MFVLQHRSEILIKISPTVLQLNLAEDLMNDRVRYESEEYELQFVTSSVTWPTPHWQVNTAKNLEQL